MKLLLVLIVLVLISSTGNAEDSKNPAQKSYTHPAAQVHVFPEIQTNNQHSNTLELTPKSISIYRKSGCLFANEFYSEGSILNFDGIKSKCVSGNGNFKWQDFTIK